MLEDDSDPVWGELAGEVADGRITLAELFGEEVDAGLELGGVIHECQGR